ncbi:transposase [Vibrio crassostreae]|uniref:transposase domain-containing protein n=1 Tax=Vibrio crassostreae TaxID=246167 RepID=UPI001043E7F0|nr:transposase domain-containing protein [Vibrio crassostreae]CAK1713780.1 transposase [Vibrio crassostreae]CAK1714888.1 transposase [Vibrio crassostreae]CAK1715417.1 transposase [Vibrio crassostreae]CAK1716159.1 transposase [Vibrio crassostreae]CAK1733180.1 transposase [Vibrio crassostreae]
MYISAQECVGLVGMPTMVHNVRNKLNKLADSNQKRKRQGSKAFEYHIDCLPEETRLHLLRDVAEQQTAQAESSRNVRQTATPASDELWLEYEEATDSKKASTKQRYELCMRVKAYVESGISMRKSMKRVAEESGRTYSKIVSWFYNIPGLQTNKIPVEDWLPALLDRIGSHGKRTAPLSQEAWSMFQADYLRPEQPTITECYNRMGKAAKREGWSVPCLSTIRERVNTDIPYELQVYCRGGLFTAKQTLVPAQRRTRVGMHAMQRVSGDGHEFRLRCHLEDGTVLRPTVWVFQDVYSSMIVGYAIDITENTEMLGIALFNMVSKFGIPEMFDLDRGSVALSEAMTGRTSRPKATGKGKLEHKKFDNAEIEGAITALGSKVNWTRVEDDNVGRKGNARAKPVERLFHSKGGIGQFERHPAFAGAYAGESATSKPANYGEATVPVELVVELFAEWVTDWNSLEGRRSEMARGIHSYKQVFEQSYTQIQVRKPTATQLRLCLHRTRKSVKVHAGGLVELNAGRYSKHLSNRYRSPLLFEYIGQSVHLRFNPYDLTGCVYAYSERGEFIGEVPLFADAAYDDLGAARRQSLHQNEDINRAAWLKEQMVGLTNDDLAQLTRSNEKPEPLGGMVPSITEMTPELARTPEQHQMNPSEFEGLLEKKAVGADFEPTMDLDALMQQYGKAK